MTEFHLAWPGPKTNSTHELTYDRHGGNILWVTGQEQDHLARVALDGTARYIAMPKGSGPHGLDVDAEGRVWVSLEFADQVVRLDGEGQIVQQIDVSIHPGGAQRPIRTSPHGLAFASDGRTLWFTGKHSGTIGRIAPDGSVAHFSLRTVGAVPIYLASGSDGNMWCTELVGNKIARISPDGEIAEFPIPTANSRPIAIVPAPDGRSMWFSEEAGNKLARIDFAGKIAEFPVPLAGRRAALAGLAFDRDGNLWTQMYRNPPNPEADEGDYIVRIDKSIAAAADGDISRLPLIYYRTPSRGTVMHRIVQGPDGNIWFTEIRGDRVGRLVTGAAPAKSP